MDPAARPAAEPAGLDETARLVALGRDRDAARRHTPDRSPTVHTTGAPVNANEQLDAVLPTLVDIARNITPDQLGNPSPCAAFDVRGVLCHMIGGAGFFAAQFRGEAPVPPSSDADVGGDDPAATFVAAMEALHAAVATPGALDRTVMAPFGEVPGEVAARFLALDGMVHGYDLAISTGQDFAPPTELVEEVLAFAEQAIAPEMRDGDTFAVATTPPAGASPLVRLVAFTGRTV